MRSKGEGSIFKTESGYRGYVTVNGRRRYFSAPTKALAAQKLRQLTAQRDTTGLSTGKTDALGAWLEHWLRVTQPTHTPKTHAGYVYAVRHYLDPAFLRTPLSKLNVERIEAEYQRLAERGLSGATRRQLHSILHSALKLAQQRGHLGVNPAALVADKPTAARRTVTAISDADVAAIKAALEPVRLKARWRLGLTLGLRPAEALGLEWQHVDLEAHTLRVGQQIHTIGRELVITDAAKTEAGARTLPLPRYLVRMLAEWRTQQQAEYAVHGVHPWSPDGTPRAWVFTSRRRPGHPVTDGGDATEWRRLLARAGVPHTRRYAARHTAASFLIANGVDTATVAQILGHRDPGFTMRTYVHTVEERLRAAASLLDEVQNEVQPLAVENSLRRK